MHRVIIDEKNVEFPLSLILAINSAEFMLESLPMEVIFWRIAVIVSDYIKPIADFWEFETKLKRFQIKVVTSIEEARKYILFNEDVLTQQFD